MAVYIVTGIMAAGKSTVAEALAKRFPLGVHVRGDVYRRMVVSGRAEMTAEPSDEAVAQLSLRYDLAAQTSQTYHDAGFTVVCQDIYIGKNLPGVVKRFRMRPLYLIVLCPRPEIAEAREAARNKTGYGGGFTPENFDAMMRAETPRIGLWLDNSDLTVDQTVDEILRRTAQGEGLIK